MKSAEAYQNLKNLFEESHTDNTNILKHLICLQDDILVEGSEKSQVSIEELKTKTTLLLISDLNISDQELINLHHIYQESANKSDYEIVWLPILDKSDSWSEANKQRYEQLQNKMPWYTLQQPEKLEEAGIRYIKEVCKFEQKTMVIVIDPLGKMVWRNGIARIWAWGKAFPLNAEEEKALWKDKIWNLELLVDAIDPNIQQWMGQGKYICLYGGEDMDWIRKFTANAKKVATFATIELELVYVGKSLKIRETIEKEILSHSWLDSTLSWYFWTRLECLLYSRMQYLSENNNEDQSDYIMQEIQMMLSFDSSLSDQGWAMVCHGNYEIMARARGDVMLESFGRVAEWKEDVRVKEFVTALMEDLKKLNTTEHCTRLILPNFDEEDISDETPFMCPECNKVMDMYTIVYCSSFD